MLEKSLGFLILLKILNYFSFAILQAKHRANDCYKRLVACRYCSKSYVADTLVTHQTKCTRAPIPCPNQCEMVALPREELDVHIKEHCNSLLVSCVFKDAGCRFKVRRTLHLNDNNPVFCQLILIILFLLEFQRVSQFSSCTP
jgi:TRAF-type zinc finger.